MHGAEHVTHTPIVLAHDLHSLTDVGRLPGRPCHLGLGKLYRRVGRLEEARAELATAVDMLREMGMTFWLPEAEAELTKTDTAEPADACNAKGPARSRSR